MKILNLLQKNLLNYFVYDHQIIKKKNAFLKQKV